MARIRTIKPGFFKNEELADLTFPTRLLFIGLWTLADKEGRMEDRPKRIKAELFPYDSVSIEDLLSKLQSAGFIVRYTVEDAELGELKLIQISNFSKHQRITGSEAETQSEYPAPLEGNILETLGNTLETPRTTGREGKGKGKGKGKEGEGDCASDEKKEPELVWPFTSETFKRHWELYKKFRAESHKFKYASVISEQAALKGLSEMSNSDEATAIKIIDQTFEKNWKGLFPLKNDGQQKNGSSKTATPSHSELNNFIDKQFAG